MESSPVANSNVQWSLTTRAEFLEGLRLLGSGFGFEAHEVWEREWLRLSRLEPSAFPLGTPPFFQAWIFLAGVSVHLKNGRIRPIAPMLQRAQELLEKSTQEHPLAREQAVLAEELRCLIRKLITLDFQEDESQKQGMLVIKQGAQNATTQLAQN